MSIISLQLPCLAFLVVLSNSRGVMKVLILVAESWSFSNPAAQNASQIRRWWDPRGRGNDPCYERGVSEFRRS